MGKLDTILDAATPVAKEAAKESVKLTGKGLKHVGKGLKTAGEKVIDSHNESKEEKVRNRIDELKVLYPGCSVFLAYEASIFNRGKLNLIGANISDFDLENTVIVFFDEANRLQFKIIEVYDSIFRRSSLFNAKGQKIGNIKSHKKLLSQEHESIYHRGNYIFNLDHKYKNGFSIPGLALQWGDGSYFDSNYKVYFNGMVAMEKIRMKGRNLVVVVDPSLLENCLLIYAAIHLRSHPRPTRGVYGGGDGDGDGE